MWSDVGTRGGVAVTSSANRPAPGLAGRDLDAIVAEKLFGYEWRRSRTTGRRCIYPPGKAPDHMQQRADGTEALVSDWMNSRDWTPRYSTDLAAAGLVIGKLHAEGWHFHIIGARQGDFADPWGVMLSLPDRVVSGPWADTLPLALCLAAIKTLDASESAPRSGAAASQADGETSEGSAVPDTDVARVLGGGAP